jgi:dTMP kinase
LYQKALTVEFEVLKTRKILLTFEGIDGCGKSTQVKLLQEKFEASAVPSIVVREPGGTAVGEDIRQVLLHNNYSLTLQTELLLYMAARSELSEQLIMPALRGGKIVICDRFTDSTMAYQGYGGGADLNLIRYLNYKATTGIFPVKTFLLDLSVEEAIARRGEKADRMEQKDFSYHQRVRYGFLEIASREPQRVIVIDAKKSKEEQGRFIWHFVNELLGERFSQRPGYEY